MHFGRLNPTKPTPFLCSDLLCAFRLHECIPTQRASSQLTAVHEASAGLTALVWRHFDTHTHTHKLKNSQHRHVKKKPDSALRIYRKWKAKHAMVLDHWVPKWKRTSSIPLVALRIVPCCDLPQIFPKLGAAVKSSILYTEAIFS